MALGKEIKVVLTLDDSGFTYKTKSAQDSVKSLEIGLGDFSKSADRVESSISSLGKNVDSFTAGFQSLQKGLQAAVDQLQKTVGGIREVDSAQRESAKVAKDSATAIIDAKKRTLENELASNSKLLADKAKTFSELRKLENDERAQSTAAMLKAEEAERRLGSFGGKNVVNASLNDADRHERSANAIRAEVQQLDRWIIATRQEQAARVSAIAALEAEKVAATSAAAAKENLSRIALAVGRNNAAEMQRLAKMVAATQKEANDTAAKSASDLTRLKKQYAEQEVRDRADAERAIRQEAAETAAQQKRQARETADEQRRQAEQVAQMWKGMAQAYAGAKIEKGLANSVDSADKYQREETLLKSLNLPKDQEDYVKQKAWDDSKALKFASSLDMVRARLAAIGGLGENNVKVIDELLQHAAMTAHNIQSITGDKSAAGFENMIRNLFGVIESRQQTNDPAAAKRTLDLVQKIYVGTGRKIDIADLETFLRRDAPGADKISDEGLAKIVAFLDQAKVSGGHGAGGAGVSTVGTMVKMFQKMANGGTMTEQGAKEFADAGLMDLSVIDGKSNKQAMKALRQGGLTVASLANEDPVGALEKISKAALSYMTRPENLKKYFPEGDTKDGMAIKNAMMKFAIGTGWSTNAVGMLTTAGNSSAMERANASAHTIMNSKGTEEMNDDVMKTYAGNIDTFKASMENLKISVGTTLLPILSDVAKALAGIINAAGDFAKNNPIMTQVTAIATGFFGAALAVKGFASMFGLLGPASTVLSTLGLSFGRVGAAASGFSALGSTVASTAAIVGRGFMRMIPYVGLLIAAWDLTNLIANFEVGGVKVIDWAIGWSERLLTSFKNGWLNVQAMFSDEAKKTKLMAEKAQNDLDLQRGLNANGMGKKAPNSAQAHADMVAQDREQAEADAAKNAPRSPLKVKPPLKVQDTSKLKDLLSGKDSTRAERVDPLTRALETAIGDSKSETLKLESLYRDTQGVAALQEEVFAELNGKRLAGDYNENRDKNKPVSEDNTKFRALVDETTQKRLLAEQIKAVTFANERGAAASIEADSALDRLTSGNIEKQTDAFRALGRELARNEARLKEGTKEFQYYEYAKASALYQQSRSDAINYGADLSDKTNKINAENIQDPRTKLEEELRLTRETEQAKFDIRMTTRQKSFDAEQQRINSEIAAAAGSDARTEAALEKKKSAEQQFNTESEQMTEAHTAFLIAQAEQQRLALRSPLEKLVDEWRITYDTIGQIEVNAANGFVSMLTSSLGTGRMEVKGFLKAILMDIANAKIKEALAEPFRNIAGSAGGLLARLFGLGGPSTAANAPSSPLMGGGEISAPVNVGSWAFANGGIMTDFGPLQLRKYAGGGIANSPQLAMYGEAGPEAYVPLPDGRSIPVTMKGGQSGGAAPAVTVNVINQTGQQANAQQGQMRFDGKQYILDVVMTAANQPGGFRSGMKDALK
ncbi:hypothetical protein QN372_00500 [Undibacterium sp. RTI2.1]|uniref:hypothetical protein n=1 Tax=unclassified Undibacterium TaxID=2630295 RepID=UPI002AB3D918|nr:MULTISPECIES: hypothetical protein [unclassified Undibacterium]MDY7537618.1 hypothetical protein [Undibacterium sp. 5I1]MEB0029219.1 hypothetical protein [Undibacterium sp. RTI2.1]MEB0115527.1 hypothetical protein [Undibacterium sp. RTI2.2]MEB0230163.1 hypothetical protein [Undibacterium sp. 10I3]MEB0256355.1 hypothetical protein [Undibacterium sp. 5I1]